MKRLIFFLFLCAICTTSGFCQIKKGSEYVYFYKQIDYPSIIACYFSADKMYFRDVAWETFESKPYSYFRKQLLERGTYVRTAYFQLDKSNSIKKVYLWYINGWPWYITFENNMKTLIDDRAGTCIYEMIEKDNDILNNDVIYE